MIEVKHVGDGEYEDVNSDIHKEYNLLVFKYAELLNEHLQLKKKFSELLDRDNDHLRELLFLKAQNKKNVRYGSLPDDE